MPLVAIKDIQEIDKKSPAVVCEAAGDFLLYQAFVIIVNQKWLEPSKQ